MATVGVITRTKSRPVMMRRALASITGQTFADYVWVIVNDGGDPGPVEEIAQAARGRGAQVAVTHNKAPTGRGAAAETGFRSADTRYVTLHDDDDTWEPGFLKRTVAFLEDLSADSSVRGVITKSMQVDEVLKDDRIVFRAKKPYKAWIESVTLFQMASVFQVPPPISFVYRRDVFDEIGYHRKDLNGLDDWEFYLRFLRRYDIAVIPEFLANYHLRPAAKNSIYSNSIIGELPTHVFESALLRNELLRRDMDNKEFGLGFIVNLQHELEILKRQSSISKLAAWLRGMLRRG